MKKVRSNYVKGKYFKECVDSIMRVMGLTENKAIDVIRDRADCGRKVAHHSQKRKVTQ